MGKGGSEEVEDHQRTCMHVYEQNQRTQTVGVGGGEGLGEEMVRERSIGGKETHAIL